MAESLGTSVLELDTDDTKLDKGLSDAKGTVKAAAAAIGVAAGAAFAAGAMESIEREALGDKLAAQLGLSGEESARAGKVAGRLYTDGYGESIAEVNDALAGIQRNIGDLSTFTEDELAGMGVKVIDIAEILGTDVESAARGAGQMIRTGLAGNADEAFDIITAGAQQSKGRQDELLETIEEYSADFASLGLSGSQAMAMINAGVEGGARNMDEAADAIREFSIRGVEDTPAVAEAFDRLGLDAGEMQDAIAEGGPAAQDAMSTVISALGDVDAKTREQAGMELFGTRFENMGLQAVEAMDPVGSSLDDVDGAADRMGDTLNDNAKTKIASFKRSVEGVLVDLVNAPGVLGTATTAVAGFGAAVQPLSPMIMTTGLLFRNQLATMGTALANLTMKTVTNTAKIVAQWALMGAKALLHAAKVAAAWLLAMGPIPLIIAAVVGLVALIVANWDKVWETTKKIFESVWEFLKDLWDKVTGFIGDAITEIKDAFLKFHPLGIIIDNWDPIWGFITDLWDDILRFLGGLPGKIADKASGMWDGIWDAFKGAINNVISAWNGLSFSLPEANVFGKTVGGWTLSTPNIPLLAEGGIVTRATLAMIGEAGDPEAVIPLDRLDEMLSGGGMPDEFTATATLDLGEGIEQVTQIKFRRHDRGLKRRVAQGTEAR